MKKASDPPFNSADGHETRHYKGEGEDNSVKYDTNKPLDDSIITTHKNLKDAEKRVNQDKKMTVSTNIQVDLDSGMQAKKKMKQALKQK